VLAFMALCSEDVSRVRLGRLTPCAYVAAAAAGRAALAGVQTTAA
jgi:hypothetical protein